MSKFHNIVYKRAHSYLTDCLRFRPLGCGNNDPLCPIFARTDKVLMSFFPSCTASWNKILNHQQRSIPDITHFKENILKSIKPKKKETFCVSDRIGLRYLTLLRVDLSPLKYYKFNHNFIDTNNSICPANDVIEDNKHCLLGCQVFTSLRTALLNNVSQKIGTNIRSFSDAKIVKILLFGDEAFVPSVNKFILNETIRYIKRTKRFDLPT